MSVSVLGKLCRLETCKSVSEVALRNSNSRAYNSKEALENPNQQATVAEEVSCPLAKKWETSEAGKRAQSQTPIIRAAPILALESGIDFGAAFLLVAHEILRRGQAPMRPSPWAPSMMPAYERGTYEVCCGADSEASIRTENAQSGCDYLWRLLNMKRA